MTTTVRAYRHPDDHRLVDRFLVDLHEPGPALPHWLQPRWEYMFGMVDDWDVDLSGIGIAERAGAVVGVVHPESRNDEVYVQARLGDREAREVLVDWLDGHLGVERDGRLVDGVFADDADQDLRVVLEERGFRPTDRGERQAWRPLVDPLPHPPLPAGYRLASLADDNDLDRLDRVLWRGFDHPGESPGWRANGRDRAQATPNYRLDRNVVAVAPGGEFAAFAGIWVVPENRVAYVEPVATDPDHRRLGLGSAAVTEALRRAREAGAGEAWVGSGLEFYRALGFSVRSRSTLWERATPRGSGSDP